MKIALLGSTGGTGLAFIDQALANGHEVKALARNPLALSINSPNLEIMAGNVFNVSSLTALFQGVEVVVSAFGIAGLWQARKPGGLYSVGGGNVIEAMAKTSVQRLLVVTSSGVEPQENDNFFFRYLLKPLFLKKMYEDMAQLEKKVTSSGLAYTIVRPPYLTNGPLTGQYRVAVNRNFSDDKDLSRTDLAHFLLQEVEQNRYPGSTVAISY
ncbi:putative NADH-flavin reductase [Spirosoma lacussanchae]|uniref:NAD(P)-dependent oxidoreductase n=1 Tax=Spirosoma lacussanchae TaxID=1884249 RepID=UPI0011095AF5|nr:SDR family oxidoreductase [Spirosoma lacussanchae]